MNRIKILIPLLVILIICSTLYATGVFGNDPMYSVGSIYKSAEKNEKEVIAKVDGEEIKSNGVSSILFSYETFGNKKSKKEVIEKIVTDELLLSESKDNNISISEEELNREIQKVKDNLPKDQKGYSDFKNLLSGLQMSEDEYWEKAKPVYKRVFTIGKYKNTVLKQEFLKQNKEIPDKELASRFNDYYNNYKKALLKKHVIEIFDK